MPKETRASDIEKAKRIRAVQEWIIDDISIQDIVSLSMRNWGLTERQIMNYVKEARSIWNKLEEEKVEIKRRRRLSSLYKLKKSLESKYRGTPEGVNVLLKVESKIIDLEGIKPPERIELNQNVFVVRVQEDESNKTGN